MALSINLRLSDAETGCGWDGGEPTFSLGQLGLDSLFEDNSTLKLLAEASSPQYAYPEAHPKVQEIR